MRWRPRGLTGFEPATYRIVNSCESSNTSALPLSYSLKKGTASGAEVNERSLLGSSRMGRQAAYLNGGIKGELLPFRANNRNGAEIGVPVTLRLPCVNHALQ